MSKTRTVVEILNSSLAKIAEIKNLYPINNQGMILRYSKELSDYGQCIFRVSTKDPVLTQFGDILKPHAYHVRIKRGSETMWQGAIVDNTERNRNYIEVRAVEYLFYLDKVLIRRDADKPDTDEDESNFRVFSTGTMAAAVTTIVNNAKDDLGTAHTLSGMTVGTIENPDYPKNFTDGSTPPRPLTGAWSFSADVTLQYDYHSALFLIKNFGNYTNADFELTNSLVFNFKKRIGNRVTGITFSYNTVGGNIIDYNVPRLGMRMSNEIVGIAADDEGKILHATQRNSTSVQTNGLLQTAKAFNDVKSKNPLEVRLTEELRLISDPEESPINIVLNEKAYPLGQYGLGDIIWIRIKDHIIDFQKERRIIGMTVTLHNTGRELVTIQTNIPPQDMLGAV